VKLPPIRTASRSSDFTAIDFATAGGICTIALNRPEKRNAQNIEMLQELVIALDFAARDPEARVVILKGRGIAFSSGHDLSENAFDPVISKLRSTPEGREALERRDYFDSALKLRNFPKPTIAQVHGACIAAGLMLVALCDLVVASTDALFSNPTVRMGANGVELPIELWAFGPRRAKEVLFTGRTVDAATAYEWGLVNRLVAPDELENATLSLATSIVSMPQDAIRSAKKSINDCLDIVGMQDTFEEHFELHQLSHSTQESADLLADRKRLKDVRSWVAHQNTTG
jgi:enoyl-CoA hydratase